MDLWSRSRFRNVNEFENLIFTIVLCVIFCIAFEYLHISNYCFRWAQESFDEVFTERIRNDFRKAFDKDVGVVSLNEDLSRLAL